ncbi:hypothetical protein J3E68DRAFT_432554 [Trichoderma sp. SZMC 28012]
MSSAALNGGKRHVDVLARGWSTSSGHPRTADAAHRRRFGRPWLGPVKIGEAGSKDLNRGTGSGLWDLPSESVCAYPKSNVSWLSLQHFVPP